MQKHLFVLFTTLFAAAVHAQTGEIVVQQPPSLPGVYGGGALLDCPQPDYPKEARRYELEGKSIVELLIGDDGRAHGQRVFASSGWKILDEATLSTLGNCRFAPVTRNGQPAGAYWKKFAYAWKLEASEGKRASRPTLLPDSCAGADRLVLTEKPFDISGILLRFLTTAEGMAYGIKVEKGSGNPAIDDEAVRVVESCKFAPGQIDGKPVTGIATARYRFDASL